MAGLKEKAATSAAALALLMVSLPTDEGKKNYPYKDVGGLLTVCYGHTGSDIQMRKYTDGECLELLEKDTKRHMNVVQGCMKRIPTPYQLAGFTSMDFNTGKWCSSRSAREFNLGNDKESCEALAYGPAPKREKVWSYVGGTFWQGLFNRRLRERSTCLTGLS